MNSQEFRDLKEKLMDKTVEWNVLSRKHKDMQMSLANLPSVEGETYRMMENNFYKIGNQKKVLNIDIRIIENKITKIINKDKLGQCCINCFNASCPVVGPVNEDAIECIHRSLR